MSQKTPHPDSLDQPSIPDELVYIYEWFICLNAGRQTGMALSTLPWVEFHAYFSLIGVKPSEDELMLIRAFDGAFVDVMGGEDVKVVDSI